MADDKNHLYLPATGKAVSLETIKDCFIVQGMSADNIADKFSIPIKEINSIIEQFSLVEIRKNFIEKGLTDIRNIQVSQAQKLLGMETDFKKMRILQLEKQLQDYAAYYARHGHFYKIHPLTKEILYDVDGIPMYIRLPNVTKEITQLKESVVLSEGLKNVLEHLDAILNTGKKKDSAIEAEFEDLSNYDGLFSKRSSKDDE
jgi:hypothetical protein